VCGGGARETAEERAAHRHGDGGATRHRRASGFSRDGGAVGDAAGETVGATAARARRSGRGGVGEATAGARSAGRLLGERGAVEAAVGTRGALSRQRL
jgi:hypothetical protein